VTGFWSTDNPKDPTRWTKASSNAGSWDGWVLADTDGKYYMVGGCGGGAYQMDPAIGAKMPAAGGCQVADVSQHGFESHVSSGNGVGGYCEGACLIKRLSRYYFFYSVPGTEFDEYCDGLGSSAAPITGFKFAQNSPVSFKPTGFLPGSGHGSAFMDKNGNWWRTVTARAAGTNDGLCRRIALYPLLFDDTINSAHTDCVFGDYPQYMPGKKPAGAGQRYSLSNKACLLCARKG
jgi:beta-xylosidase